MRVLMVNSVAATGSTGMICRALWKKVTASGGEAVIACGRATAAPGIATHPIGTKMDIYAHGLQTRLLDAHGFGSRRATEKFVRWMKEYDPDIIHLHNLHGYYLNIGVLFRALREMNKPVVWTLHDCWAFTGHCAHYGAVECEKWRTGCHHCPQKHTYPASLLRDGSAGNYQRKRQLFTLPQDMTLVTPSSWLAGELANSFLNRYPVLTIHNGIDTSIFRPTPTDILGRHGLAGKRIALAAAHVWHNGKGLREMRRLADALGHPWQVVLVGKFPRRMPPLPANVTCISRISDPAVLAAWYSAADVFVNPTHGDTFPTTNLEAQACGTPVVTFPAGGSPESIYPPLRQRLICPDFQVQSLSDCVRRAAELTPLQRQEIAAWAAEAYELDKFTDHYYRLYQSLLQRSKQP